jgi:hypothetical protein
MSNIDDAALYLFLTCVNHRISKSVFVRPADTFRRGVTLLSLFTNGQNSLFDVPRPGVIAGLREKYVMENFPYIGLLSLPFAASHLLFFGLIHMIMLIYNDYKYPYK